MSRIGKKEISIPSEVEVTIESTALGPQVKVKGPLGQMERRFRPEVEIRQEDKLIKVTCKVGTRQSRAYQGLSRTLLNNMIQGVVKGFKKELDIVGVGYRALLKGNKLDFQIGKSHPVVVEPPDGIKFEVAENNTRIIVNGYDKELVGQISANIIALRPPEPYKGKGIRLRGQKIKRKVGKSGAKA